MKSIVILDCKGQYSQLIARRIREEGVYSVILYGDTDVEDIKKHDPMGIIITGGPDSVYWENAITVDKRIFDLDIPILGICYGAQLISHLLGGKVESASSDRAEFGRTKVEYKDSLLFDNLCIGDCWMSHTDYISRLPEGFYSIATSKNCDTAAIANEKRKIYATQFHPEVNHTEHHKEIMQNFLFKICGAKPNWTEDDFIEKKIAEIKEIVKDDKAILGLSGGVDSTVAAAIVSKAIGKNLTCILVDHGLMRLNEAEEVERLFKEKFEINFVKIDARKRFLDKLKGVIDPETKRKIIGEEFIRVFEDAKKSVGDAKFLVQGTIYPDVVESGLKKEDVIKSHHNVGGLPEDVDFEILEPLRMLFKDEVRNVGRKLGIADELVDRHPFPGPGLGIRIIGEITEEKLDILRRVDDIYIKQLRAENLYNEIWQAFAVLPDIKTVGVQGDKRTYSYMVALRAVNSMDAMTAESYPFTHDFLNRIQIKIINEVPEVNRVVYDITSKPPGTIEWE